MKLEALKINKSFQSLHVLKDIDLHVRSGRASGFLGRNGAGKTTMFRILMDVFRADSGQILLDAKPFIREEHHIGYLPEERGMYGKIKIVDQLIYFSSLRGISHKTARENTIKWLDRFQLNEYTNKPLETLSKGNQQKVQIAQAFINDPEILILDEPFSGLDPVNAQMFKDALREFIKLDKLVIFSSHQMAYVEEFCDDITLIEQGEVILSGELATIKKELGQNKLRIDLADKSVPETQAALTRYPLTCSSDGLSTIVTLKEGYTKNRFFRDLADESLEVALFSEYRPSLEEIFVSKVGQVNA